MKKAHYPVFLTALFSMTGQILFSQNNIVIENTVINNTATYYGAMNSITCPGMPTNPVTILTGDKKVEFVAGHEIHMLPGFHATAQPGGSFKAYIDPAFSVTTNPFSLQPNEFSIGMFGFNFINKSGSFYLNNNYPTGILEQPANVGIPDGVTGTYLFNGTTQGKSSQLNVLKEDGFNTVFDYVWLEGFLGDNSVYIPMIELAKNNGLQLMATGAHWWKPYLTGFDGTNVYDGRGNLPANTTGMVMRPDYDDLLDNILTNENYKSTIWGYHMTEEPSHGQPASPNDAFDWCWNACDDAIRRRIDWPTTNVSNAIGHFRNKLNGHGVFNQKLVVMDSHHQRAINDNSDDGNKSGSVPCMLCPGDGTLTPDVQNGGMQPQYYINPGLMGNNMPDVFFEGSYWFGMATPDGWADNKYGDINNSGYHYLGVFKSIDYAYSKGVKEVHKVIDNSGLHFDLNIQNANGLWFQAYTSIIHGAKGIWFWEFLSHGAYYSAYPPDVLRENNMLDASNPARFNRENTPLIYNEYAGYLAKELAYLSGKNLISTDPKTVLYNKTDNADPNCIVPASNTYIPDALKDEYGNNWEDEEKGIYGDVADDGEAYGLRYTIRTNGDEVIMIISNPLGIALHNIVLNFNHLTNPVIKSAGGVDVLFGDPQYFPDDINYKTYRSNSVDLNNLTVGTSDFYYVPFWTNKQLQISFGPLDVKILRFVTSPSTPLANYDNGWEKVWTNNSNNAISNWLLRTSDHIVKGDFNGDTDDELICTQQTSKYASLLDFYGGEWKTIWSNNGNNAIDTWLIRNSDILVSGDFDGDSKDELLCVQQESAYATMLKYENNNWATAWSNGGNNAIGTWLIRNSDKMLVGDFDGDSKDELLCIQDISNYATMLRYVNGNWQDIWSNLGSGYVDNWQITNLQQYKVADFNNDGKDDIVCFSPTIPVSASTAEILHYLPALDNNPPFDPAWSYSNTQLNGFTNWQINLYADVFFGGPAPVGTVMAGNIDYDGKEELMYVSSNGRSRTAEQADDNSILVKWDNTASVRYIDDWDAGDILPPINNYMLVKAEKYMPEYLLAFNGANPCIPFLVSMYRSQDMTDKRITPAAGDSTKVLSGTAINNLEDYITIFPNPSSGMFTLVTGANVDYSEGEKSEEKTEQKNKTYDVYVYNSMGKEVYSKHNIPSSITQFSINLESQSKGMYLVRIVKKTGKSTTAKVIVD